MPKYYFKSAVLNMVPFIVAAAGILFFLILFLIKRKKVKKHYLINNIILTIVVVGHKYQPSIIDQNFTSFVCVNLYREDTRVLFLEADYDLECWVGTHKLYTFAFALPFIMVWFVILPIALFYKLYKLRRNFNNGNVKQRYSFLYRGYVPSKYYWEFIVMIRKYALTIIVVFGSFHSANIQIYACIYVILLSYYI